MTLLNKYCLKYAGILIVTFGTMMFTESQFPDLYVFSDESGSFTKTTLFALYRNQFFGVIPALFMFWDLRKHHKTAFFIPLLTILHLEVGLLFFGFAVFNNLMIANYE